MKTSQTEKIRILKYLFSAGSSFLLDLGVFAIITFLMGEKTKDIFIATIGARAISSSYNYFINSRVVFQNKSKKGMVGYFALVIIQMMVSATVVSILKKWKDIFATILKFVVDLTIFIVNYIVQKEVIFR